MKRRPFFASTGRTGVGPFLAWVALGLGAFMLCLVALRPGGYPVLVTVFALIGAIVAKLRAEAVRRLRDIGARAGTGWLLAIVGVVGFGYALLRWLLIEQDVVAIGCMAGVLLILGGGLLRPGGADSARQGGGSGWGAAAVCIAGGALIGLWAASVLDGMAQAHREQADWAARNAPPTNPPMDDLERDYRRQQQQGNTQ